MAGPIDVPSVPGHVLVRRAAGQGPVYIPAQPEVGQFQRVIVFDHQPDAEELAAYGDLPVVQTWHMQESEARERGDFEIVTDPAPQTALVVSAPAQPVEHEPDAPAEDEA